MNESVAAGSGVVVTFGIADALYALSVESVVEILDTLPITPLPNAPGHLLGLIDRRGVSVPVVDLRRLLGVPPRADASDTRIVVLRLDHGGDLRIVGLRLDRVIEVTALDDAGGAPLAEAELLGWDEGMVAGIGRRNGAFVTVLHLAGLFDGALRRGKDLTGSAA